MGATILSLMGDDDICDVFDHQTNALSARTFDQKSHYMQGSGWADDELSEKSLSPFTVQYMHPYIM
jgi:hypothetical protein